jgi:hypothetical protein
MARSLASSCAFAAAYVSKRQHASAAYVSLHEEDGAILGIQLRQYLYFCTSKASKVST